MGRTLTITRRGSIYVAKSRYEDRHVLKEAGFRWNPDEKLWWTSSRAVALRLGEYCDKTVTAEESGAVHDVRTPEGLSLLPYQLAGAKKLISKRTVLLADDMGLGKTVQAVVAANALEDVRRVIVVSPLAMVWTWASEWKRWSTRKWEVSVCRSTKDWPQADVVIINYDIIHAHASSLECDLLICDEAHAIKSRHSRRTKAVKAVKAKRKWALTGTPMMNRPAELWSIMEWLDRTEGLRWGQYAKRYCGAKLVRIPGGRVVWDYSGATNLDELHSLISPWMLRRTKAQVLSELPPKIRRVIEVEGRGDIEALQRHRELVKKLKAEREAMHGKAEFSQWAKNAAVKVSESAANLARIRKETAMQKLPHVAAICSDVIEAGQKVVVFAHHHEIIDALSEALSGHAVLYDGRCSDEKKRQAIEAFQTGNANVFVGGITAAGFGLTLTAASHIIFAELDWTPARIIQAEDRCHRIGQKGSVVVDYVVVRNSIDALIAKTIVSKARIIRKIIAGTGEKNTIFSRAPLDKP